MRPRSPFSPIVLQRCLLSGFLHLFEDAFALLLPPSRLQGAITPQGPLCIAHAAATHYVCETWCLLLVNHHRQSTFVELGCHATRSTQWCSEASLLLRLCLAQPFLVTLKVVSYHLCSRSRSHVLSSSVPPDSEMYVILFTR